MAITFNKPYLTGKEAHYIYQAVYTGQLSGNGVFTKKCQQFFEEKYGFKKAIMTTSGRLLCLSLARNYGPAGPLR